MKKSRESFLRVISLIACLACLLNVAAYADDVQNHSGSIIRIQGRDVLLRSADVSVPFETGQKLQVDTDAGTAVIEVVFPMQTTSKCRLLTGKESWLRIGMVAYSGIKKMIIAPVGSMKINADGTASDARSGLTWVRKAGVSVNLDDAMAAAAELRTGGFSDWRVPDRDEMLTLVDVIPADVRQSGKGMEFLRTKLGFTISEDQLWTTTRSHDHGATDERYYFCMPSTGEIGDIHRVGECSYIAVRGTLKEKFRTKGE